MSVSSSSIPSGGLLHSGGAPRLAYSVNDLSRETSIGRTSLYAEAKAGRLKLTHVCGRTIILAEDARAWLRGETNPAAVSA